jgi:hypothetical protein
LFPQVFGEPAKPNRTANSELVRNFIEACNKNFIFDISSFINKSSKSFKNHLFESYRSWILGGF